MIRLTGDAHSFNRFATATSDQQIEQVLAQWKDVPLLPILVQHVMKVFHEMKWLVLLSVVMPQLLQGTVRVWRRKWKREGLMRGDSELPPGDGVAAAAVRSSSFREVFLYTVHQLVRRTTAVLVMPAVFWLTMLPLVTKFLGGPRHRIFRHRWALALLPMLAGTFSIWVEGPKRAKILAIFMACTAVSSGAP